MDVNLAAEEQQVASSPQQQYLKARKAYLIFGILALVLQMVCLGLLFFCCPSWQFWLFCTLQAGAIACWVVCVVCRMKMRSLLYSQLADNYHHHHHQDVVYVQQPVAQPTGPAPVAYAPAPAYASAAYAQPQPQPVYAQPTVGYAQPTPGYDAGSSFTKAI